MYNMDYYEVPYLMHHGILGQRWGIRRYQNKDGSLTPRGRKRLEQMGLDPDKYGSKTKSKSSKSTTPKRKTVKSMTNEEIKAKTDRINLENNYRAAQEKSKSYTQSKEEKKSAQVPVSEQPKVDQRKDHSAAAMLREKSVNYMTNEELKAYNDRKGLEATFASYNPKQVSKGKKFANFLIKEGWSVAQKPLEDMGKEMLTNYLNGNGFITKAELEKKKKSSVDYSSAARRIAKSMSQMTDKELRDFNDRVKQEDIFFGKIKNDNKDDKD